jgi:hypothetical protein
MTSDDKDLDDLFALARRSRTDVPEALSTRVLADAVQAMPKRVAPQVVQRPAARRTPLGLGWLQASGLVAVGVMGVLIGVMNPLISGEFGNDAYSLSDLMPGFQDVLTDEAEG